MELNSSQNIVGIVVLIIVLFGVGSGIYMSQPVGTFKDMGTYGVDRTNQTGGKKYMNPSYGIVGFIFAFSIFAWDYLTNS